MLSSNTFLETTHMYVFYCSTFFCKVVKRVYGMYFTYMYLTTTCFLIAQRLVFPTSEDLMVYHVYFIDASTLDLKCSHTIQV